MIIRHNSIILTIDSSDHSKHDYTSICCQYSKIHISFYEDSCNIFFFHNIRPTNFYECYKVTYKLQYSRSNIKRYPSRLWRFKQSNDGMDLENLANKYTTYQNQYKHFLVLVKLSENKGKTFDKTGYFDLDV